MLERRGASNQNPVHEFTAQVSEEPQRKFSPRFLKNVVWAINRSVLTELDDNVKNGLYLIKCRALAKVFELFESGDRRVKVEISVIDTADELGVERLFFIFLKQHGRPYITRTKIENLVNSGISEQRIRDTVREYA